MKRDALTRNRGPRGRAFGFSRADLWLLAALLGVFALVDAASLTTAGSVPNALLTAATVLAVGAGAGAALMAAARWEDDPQEGGRSEQVDRLDKRSAAA